MIELKSVHRWPRRDIPVRMGHYTLHQRIWHKQWADQGGEIYLFLKVTRSREYLMFDGVWAADNLGEVSKEMMIEKSLIHEKGKFPEDQLWHLFCDR